tara:strand:- start:304 stop:1314 length:1011 start_codon:yes stop_codon:yes gene_type:complete
MSVLDSVEWSKQAAWKNVGTQVENRHNIQAALQEAGVAYGTPVKEQMASVLEDGTIMRVPGRYNLHRPDTGAIVGTDVTSRYQPVAFEEALGIFDGVAESGRIEYDSVITKSGGSEIFVSARLPDQEFDVVEGDTISPWMWMRASHNSTASICSLLSLDRAMSCDNQWTAAMGKSNHIVKVRHTKSARWKVEQYADSIVDTMTTQVEQQKTLCRQLAGTSMGVIDFDNFLEKLFPMPKEPAEGEPTRGWTIATHRRELLDELFIAGRGQDIPGVRYTRWAALNAVTEYTTHHMNTKTGVERDDPRYAQKRDMRLAESSLFGGGATINKRALALLTA